MSALEKIDFEGNEIEIGGLLWKKCWWDNKCLRKLTTNTDHAHISIEAYGDSAVSLRAAAPGRPSFRCQFKSIEEAVEAAKTFEWEELECGGVVWTVVWSAESGNKRWRVELNESDTAEIYFTEGGFVAHRIIGDRQNGRFELDYYRDSENQIHTFEEAVAIVLSMPTFIHSLSARI